MKRLNVVLVVGLISATSVAFAAGPTVCESTRNGVYKTCVGFWSKSVAGFAVRKKNSDGFGIGGATVRLYECRSNTYCGNEIGRSREQTVLDKGETISVTRPAKLNRYYYTALYSYGKLIVRSPRTYNK